MFVGGNQTDPSFLRGHDEKNKDNVNSIYVS